MKYLVMLLPLLLTARIHYAKVEPIEQATIKASVGGIITRADRTAEGSVLGEDAFVQIDDALDRASLKDANASLHLLRESLVINEEMLTGLKATLDRRQSAYERLKDLASASQSQKDNSYAAFVAAKNQYLGTREKIITLKKQILDLEYQIALLKDTIAKKHIAQPGKYLYQLMVRSGEFATPGMPLAVVQDTSRAKLTLFLDRDELVDSEGKKIEEKTIYIDGKPTKLHLERIWKVADSQYVSAYRARIVMLPKYPFSKLVKVEFR